MFLNSLGLVLFLLAPQEASPTAAAAEPRARTHVLHLTDGRVLRVRARELDGTWEIEQKKERVRLPAALVERATPESELLAQAGQLARKLERGNEVQRVAYADWLVGAGLHEEAARELERVLAAEPDQKDALALLARAELPLGIPALPEDESGLDAFLGQCARLTAVGREAVVLALAESPEVPGLRAALGRDLLARPTARRSFATLALRRLFPGSEAEGLISRTVLDASDEVRASAARSLDAFDDPQVIEPVVRALYSKHAELRLNAAEALGAMSYREAVQPLVKRLAALQSGGGSYAPRQHIYVGTQNSYIQDFDVEVAQGAAIADPIVNIMIEGSVLDVAVVGVTDYRIATESVALRRSLEHLTGQKPGDSAAAWERWWKEHGNEWQAGSAPNAPTSPAGRGR
jgi:hypothetical protein